MGNGAGSIESFVDGQRLVGGGEAFNNLNPASGALLGRVHDADGARLVVGGGRVDVPGLAQGYFVAPTIFAGCADGMAIVREEIFGPVLSMLEFDDEAEAVARANATRFGLAAGVFTRDLARGHRVAARLRAGLCWINNYNITPIEMPFGGAGESGIGHENSMVALDHYTQLKTVYVELGEVACGYR